MNEDSALRLSTDKKQSPPSIVSCPSFNSAGGASLGVVAQHLKFFKTSLIDRWNQTKLPGAAAVLTRFIPQNLDGISLSFSGSLEIKRIKASPTTETAPSASSVTPDFAEIRRLEGEVEELRRLIYRRNN